MTSLRHLKRSGKDGINFSINGEKYFVNPENGGFDPETPLVDFIRNNVGLKGTKTMCREGGCGACVVSVKCIDPGTGAEIIKATNSCLTPVLSCDGWDISTIEKLGNKKVGYHKIQQRLAKFNGLQCGFCTPGMVMSMYSLMNSKKDVKVQDVHDNFDGNICRCTGYRPIMDAFKSLAVDAPEHLQKQCQDIENCASYPCAPSPGAGGCDKVERTQRFNLSSGQDWVQATDLDSALAHMKEYSKDNKKYRVVAGNTGTGVFKHDGPYDAFVDVNNVAELKKCTLDDDGVILGGGITLSAVINVLIQASKLEGYAYTADMSRHLERVANTPVRNNATIAGNLMLKHKHNEFPSDIFLLLETVGARINIASRAGGLKPYKLTEFIDLDMDGKLIISLSLPQRKGNYRFRTFKIAKRYQNAHAYVNAAFLFKVNPAENFKVIEKPRIVYGGIHPKFVHASSTESFLNGKYLGDEQVLKGALDELDKEINPLVKPPDATPEYRKTLTQSLLYKTILGITENKNDRVKSGGLDIKREIGKGVQTYDTDKDDWVLYKHLPKIEAAVQASGEAQFVNDIPPRPDELYGAFVLSTVACADIKSIDASEALKIPGVVRLITAKDVPGTNDFMSYALYLALYMEEPFFAKDKVVHFGQSLGLILAKTSAGALAAAKKVKVTYENERKPLVNLKEALTRANADGKLKEFTAIKSVTPVHEEKPKHVVKGEFQMGGQYHFHMETQSCVCIKTEDGMDVFSSTQWPDQVQINVANALAVPANNINVEVRRIGGGFGAKLTRASQIATACAVAAHTVNKPVRVILDLETNMHMIGTRLPYIFRYEAGFDDEGKIGNLKVEAMCEPGSTDNEQDSELFPFFIQNTYQAVGWEITPGFLLTDTTSNTYMRAPGSLQGVVCIEYIMEHIAHELQKDSLEVRLANFMKKGDPIFPRGNAMETENICTRILDEIKVSADFDARRKAVQAFNQEHRWKKRGIALVPARFAIDFFNAEFRATVVIYHNDGSVAVSHAGVEMGQGINTKVAQTVANTLRIPIEKIKIKPTNTFSGANGALSGGSFTSELCSAAAKKAAQILADRLEPIKAGLEDKSWEKVVKAAYDGNIDLSASHMHGPNDADYKEYLIWLVNITEVEVDILTGEYKVVRVDITEDVGKSLNPAIDIGQIEGACLMGQGLFTSEKLVYDQETGELLTFNTWEYKPPESKDVPEDFRITLLSNSPNPYGIMRSKAVGEPPLVSTCAVFFALRNAIDSARKDAGNDDWYQIDTPVTPEDVVRLCLTSSSQFGFQ